MGFDTIRWAREQRCGSPVAKAVLAAIATYADDEGKAWPSQEQLAVDTEFSVRAVQDALAILVRRKLLYRCPRYAAGGGRLVDTIVLSIPAGRAGLPRSKPAGGADHTGTSCLGTTNRELPEEVSPSDSPSALSTPVSKKTAGINEALAAWNALAEELGLPKAAKLTPTRRARLAARLKDAGGLDGWRTALALIRTLPPFFRGDNENLWKANLDWLLRESSFTKLMEGTYGTYKSSGKHSARRRNSSAEVIDLLDELDEDDRQFATGKRQ